MLHHELIIRQVPTLEKIADLNTKSHGRHRFLCLVYMLGFVTSKGAFIGEDEFAKFQAKQATKQHLKLIGQILKDDVGNHGCSTNVNNTAKRIPRVLSMCSFFELASSHDELSPISTPEPWVNVRCYRGVSGYRQWWSLLVVGLAFLVVVGAVRFRGGNFNCDDIPQEPAVEEVAVQDEADNDAGETVPERLYRYNNDSISECSDPDFSMEVNHMNLSIESESEQQPHEPYAANFIEAIDVTRNEVDDIAICNYLMVQCTRRLQEAGDEGNRRFYTDAVGSLEQDSFDRFESGELNDSSGEFRNIFRVFARLFPRPDSLTSSLSVQQISDELRRYEQNQPALDNMEIDDEEQPMNVDFNGVGVNDEALVNGPLNHDDSVLQDIHQHRTRVLAEIQENLHQAYDTGTQEDIWYWQSQEDWWANVIRKVDKMMLQL